MSKIIKSVLIVSNWQQRRQSLVSILNSIADECSNSAVELGSALSSLSKNQVDLLLVDRWEPGVDIAEFLCEIKQKYAGTRILVLDCLTAQPHSRQTYPVDMVLDSDTPSNKILDAVQQLLSTRSPALNHSLDE